MLLREEAAQAHRRQQHRHLAQQAAVLRHGLPSPGVVQSQGGQSAGHLLPVDLLLGGQGNEDGIKGAQIGDIKPLRSDVGAVLHDIEIEKGGVGIEIPHPRPGFVLAVLSNQPLHQRLVQFLAGQGAHGVPAQGLHLTVGPGELLHGVGLGIVAVVVAGAIEGQQAPTE